MVLAIGFYGVSVATFVARVERENAIKSEMLAQEAKWHMLRFQVNPHFLFNALNTVRAMLPIDQIAPRKLITQLSDYFRSTLSIDHNEISIIDEWNIVQNYLEIQKTRFQEKLIYKMTLEDEIKDLEIPVFAIQILVENAIKYGMKTSSMPLIIEVNAYVKDNCYIINVTNSGKMFDSVSTGSDKQVASSRTGLDNLKNRLLYFNTCTPSFTLNEEDGKVVASIRLIKE